MIENLKGDKSRARDRLPSREEIQSYFAKRWEQINRGFWTSLLKVTGSEERCLRARKHSNKQASERRLHMKLIEFCERHKGRSGRIDLVADAEATMVCMVNDPSQEGRLKYLKRHRSRQRDQNRLLATLEDLYAQRGAGERKGERKGAEPSVLCVVMPELLKRRTR